MSIPTALLLSVCLLAMWVVDYVRMPELWRSLLATQGLVTLNAVLLCTLLYRRKVADRFSLVPAMLYIAAVGVFPYLRMHWQPQLLAGILLVFLFAAHNKSDSRDPDSIVFFVSVLFCLAALFITDALWCIALVWVAVLLQGAFSLRTVLASVLAALMVAAYCLAAVYAGWTDGWDLTGLLDREWIVSGVAVSLTLTVTIVIIAFLAVTVSAFMRSSYDLVSARLLLSQVAVWGVLSLPLILLYAGEPDSLELLVFALSATSGIYLLQKESEARGITLLVYLAGSVALYLWLVYSL